MAKRKSKKRHIKNNNKSHKSNNSTQKDHSKSSHINKSSIETKFKTTTELTIKKSSRYVVIIVLILLVLVLIYVVYVLITKVNQAKNEVTPQDKLLQVRPSGSENLIPNTLNPQQTSPAPQNFKDSSDQLLPQQPSWQQQGHIQQ